MQNALLIQTAFIGDVILTTPMMRALKKAFPKSRLTVVVRPEAAPLLERHPEVDEIYVIDKKGKDRGLFAMWKITCKLRAASFDLLLAPHRSSRTALLALFSAIPARYGYRSGLISYFAYHKRFYREKNKAEIRRLLDFLGAALQIDTSKSPLRPIIHVSEKAHKKAQALLHSFHASQSILIAPSSVWPTKRWPSWHFASLIAKLARAHKTYAFFIIGAPADAKVCAQLLRFVQMFQKPEIEERIYNICGQLSLPELYALMCLSALLVSNDSAPVHLASAAKLPVAAIFGPTTPALGYAPLGDLALVVEKELGCRPCGLHGHKQCPQKHFRCMKELSPHKVFESSQKLLEKSRRRSAMGLGNV